MRQRRKSEKASSVFTGAFADDNGKFIGYLCASIREAANFLHAALNPGYENVCLDPMSVFAEGVDEFFDERFYYRQNFRKRRMIL